MRPRPTAAAVVAVALPLALGGCATSGTERPTLTVYAAASLSAPFSELVAEFEREHPGVSVAAPVFDGSATLATQIAEGAPADVFAAADTRTLDRVASHVDGEVRPFAHNVLQLAVAPGNPLGIDALADVADPGVQLVLCAPQVPCGAAATRLLDLAGVAASPASEEQNVTAVLAKVAAGEADAGLVYVTDVAAARGTVDGIDIPGADRAVNEYVVAALEGAAHAEVARDFVDFVLSDRGRAVLARHGFAP